MGGRGVGEIIRGTYTACTEVMAPDAVLQMRSSKAAISVARVGW